MYKLYIYKQTLINYCIKMVVKSKKAVIEKGKVPWKSFNKFQNILMMEYISIQNSIISNKIIFMLLMFIMSKLVGDGFTSTIMLLSCLLFGIDIITNMFRFRKKVYKFYLHIKDIK